VELPDIRYARSGDVSIAYQVVGEGPLDLIVAPGFVSNLDFEWTEPRIADFRRRLARISRLILFDKRGTGLSDQVHGVPTLEERMDDVRAVMDAAGSERAVVMGLSDGASLAALFAATYPERTPGMIIYGASPRMRSDPERLERYIEDMRQRWGTQELADEDLRVYAPSVAREPGLREWTKRWIRYCVTPGAFEALLRMNAEIDVRPVLQAIHVPTLVLHRTGDRAVALDRGREFADGLPASRFVELPGIDHYPWFGDSASVIDAIEQFMGGLVEEAAFERVLTTVLFTDIVGSTERAVELGDRAWRELLEQHHAIVRSHLSRFRGRELDTAGDGFLASFDGPARGIRCASAISESLRELGVDIRAGLHTGECEVVGTKFGGIGVHIGARVAAQAEPGEVLVSSTVKDLVAGSGIEFEDRGTAELKGVPGEWRLYAVA
jgi:class 3 adenylate cyclase/pimeloyl-ACP methyl ester carboxylesterase